MKKAIVRVLSVAAIIVAATVVGRVAPTPVAHANPVDVKLLNPGVCTALTQPVVTTGCTINGQGGLQYLAGLPGTGAGDTNLRTVAAVLGKHYEDVPIAPADFTGVATFSGGQLHQGDAGFSASLSRLAVIAFVQYVGPVTFQTTTGFFSESNGQTWVCDGTGVNPDSDCGGPNVMSQAPELAPDRVVVAYLDCSFATCPTLGDFRLTVEQGGIVFPVNFTVVGEPRKVTFFTLEDAIQAGVDNDPATGKPICPFSASLPFIQKALGEAERTVVVARALDINETAIAGAWFEFSVDQKSQGAMALAVAPTLNLGGFGYGAPNILCAPRTATDGTVTVTARLIRKYSGLYVDPDADQQHDPADFLSTKLAFGKVTFNVQGLPTTLALTAAPEAISCDGQTTSTVSAAVIEASGKPAISGTQVHFDVQTFGTANPIEAMTNDKGIATSAIAPLSGLDSGIAKGVTVNVTIPVTGEQAGTLVRCLDAGAVPPASAPGAAASGSAGAPSAGGARGAIIGPNTGSGGLETRADNVDSRLAWGALAIGVVVLLFGAQLTRERRHDRERR